MAEPLPFKSNRYSYSGADARAYTYIAGMPANIREIESLQTISWSIHEAKGQARALGKRGIVGISRGIRTIAGSLIMTVIEDNPLKPFMDNYILMRNTMTMYESGWSLDFDLNGTGSAFNSVEFTNRIAPLLPPCNILIRYINEAASWDWDSEKSQFQVPGAALLLSGVEFIDEGGVTSIQDTVTEITLSFIAVDMKPISMNTFTSQDTVVRSYLSPYDAGELELMNSLYGPLLTNPAVSNPSNAPDEQFDTSMLHLGSS